MITISPITLDQINAMEAQLAANGTTIATVDTNHWSLSGQGVIASAVFDPAQNALNVTVLHKPFVATMSYVEGRIRQGIEAAITPKAA